MSFSYELKSNEYIVENGGVSSPNMHLIREMVTQELLHLKRAEDEGLDCSCAHEEINQSLTMILSSINDSGMRALFSEARLDIKSDMNIQEYKSQAGTDINLMSSYFEGQKKTTLMNGFAVIAIIVLASVIISTF
ncbi:hypothetical protein SOJ85_001842 [Cronobacter turicensis]|nr:hypothetical protein [Cronobacter turicensis]